MTPQRYRVFKISATCAHCGVEGKFFALERHKFGNTERYHFNLYGIDKAGDEVMLTKDHIIPKARCGGNSIDNMQTLCAVCNLKKADKY